MHTPLQTTYTSLREVLDKFPEDWDIRLVLADCCEELGDLLQAEFWRWAHEHKKRAFGSTNNPGYLKWWPGEMRFANSYLPVELYHLLRDDTKLPELYDGKAYSSNLAADDALFAAWKVWKVTVTPK